jgi:membrane-associated phospholipid phosphatase
VSAVALALAIAVPASAAINPVVEWNRTLLTLLRTPGAQPATVHPTRSMAIVHRAIYEAVLTAKETPRPGSRRASVDAAAHTALVALFPGQSETLDQQYAAALADTPNTPRRERGIRIGEAAARQVLEERATDNAAAPPPPFTPTSTPGDYQLTPPAFTRPVFTHWPRVTPFALVSADQFRPPPPPALASAEYATALNEVEALGRIDSTTRSDDQSQAARFWAAPIQNYWNEIGQTAVLAHHARLDTSARVFALLDTAIADSVIAFYDAKYFYRLWRPITAIRAADIDGNPATDADPTWTPLATTPADPSYPGAHSVVSAAASTVLTHEFGDHFEFGVRSEVLPEVERSFPSFSAAAREAGRSRIWAGVHTSLDDESGQALGTAVAVFTLQNAAGQHP